MPSSNYQTTLTAALALGLGFVLSGALGSNDAVGYPAGPTVSYGSNPIESVGGTVTTGAATVFTASADAPFIVKDVVISIGTSGGMCLERVYLENGPAATLTAQFTLSADGDEDGHSDDSATSTGVSQSYVTGIVVPAGQSMTIRRSGSCGTMSYSLAGYHAHS